MARDIPARLGPIRFEFESPQLSRNAEGLSATHEILPTDEDGDGETVVQPLGSGTAKLTLRGDIYLDEAKELDDLEGRVVALRHERRSGDVFVSNVDTSPQNVEDERGKRYEARIELVEA